MIKKFHEFEHYGKSVVLPISTDIEKMIVDCNLYHVTKQKNALNIITHDYFRTTMGVVGIKGLSTTFDSKYHWGSNEVKFILDYHKLNEDYQLIFVDEKLGIDESEIKVVSDTAITNARKYIKDILYNGSDEDFVAIIKEYLIR